MSPPTATFLSKLNLETSGPTLLLENLQDQSSGAKQNDNNDFDAIDSQEQQHRNSWLAFVIIALLLLCGLFAYFMIMRHRKQQRKKDLELFENADYNGDPSYTQTEQKESRRGSKGGRLSDVVEAVRRGSGSSAEAAKRSLGILPADSSFRRLALLAGDDNDADGPKAGRRRRAKASKGKRAGRKRRVDIKKEGETNTNTSTSQHNRKVKVKVKVKSGPKKNNNTQLMSPPATADDKLVTIRGSFLEEYQKGGTPTTSRSYTPSSLRALATTPRPLTPTPFRRNSIVDVDET